MVEVGDIVFHRSDNHPSPAAKVTGFCGAPKFVRVKTPDGRHRIWSASNFFKLNDEQTADFESLFQEQQFKPSRQKLPAKDSGNNGKAGEERAVGMESE